jgi:hypothetical protein
MALPLILGAVSGVANLIGAFGKKDEAKRQLDAQRTLSQQQRSTFTSGYGDLMSQAKGAATYQGDISKYTKIEQAADLAKRMASGQSRGSGEQIARDQAAQTSANVLAAATRGAGSGTDIMTAALLSQQGENQAQNAISTRSAEEQRVAKAAAMAQEFAAFGNTAAASARERGLEFSSLANKQANIMGVTQSQMEGELNLNQQLFDQEQAKAAALEEARGAIWSGIGNIASGVSSGMMGMANQKAQMAMLNKIYGGGSTGGDVLTGARAFASNAIGSGTSLAKVLNPNFGQMGIFPQSGYSLPYEAMMSNTMPIKRDIIKK